MATKTKFGPVGKSRDAYWECIQAFPLTSIRSHAQLKEAQKVMDTLLSQEKLDPGEEMYLDALSDLVATYEDKHHPIAPPSDAAMLRHLMEARGITQAELSRELDIAKSVVSEILNGKKRFSRGLIHKFAEYFNVDKTVLAANI